MRAAGSYVDGHGDTFPFLFGGTFIEGWWLGCGVFDDFLRFPFLFGGTFIEGPYTSCRHNLHQPFPFLFGGTFIEGVEAVIAALADEEFPFLFGGTFIEGLRMRLRARARWRYFPSFSEGLSLRGIRLLSMMTVGVISLPFRRDFH